MELITIAGNGRGVVQPENHEVFASSRDVAEFCDKKHKNVLRDIVALLADFPPDANPRGWYFPTSYRQRTGFGWREYPAYDMTRSGFMLLVMGYTGPRAAEFKCRVIEQFNAMEELLRKQGMVQPFFTEPALANQVGLALVANSHDRTMAERASFAEALRQAAEKAREMERLGLAH